MAFAEKIGKDDLERQGSSEDEKPQLPSYGKDETRRGSVDSYHEGFFGAFKLESFKRNPNARVVTEATDSEGRPLPDQPPAEPALAMKLKERHLQMIAIGGSIGIYRFRQDEVNTDHYFPRHWPLRRLRFRVGNWRSSFAHHRLWFDRMHVILHCSCSGRDGSRFSSRWCILCLLESFHWSVTPR
jgi:hypothetical protein